MTKISEARSGSNETLTTKSIQPVRLPSSSNDSVSESSEVEKVSTARTATVTEGYSSFKVSGIQIPSFKCLKLISVF